MTGKSVTLTAALAAGGRIVDESNAPAHWTLADRAGNRVCLCAWPDGATFGSARGAAPGGSRVPRLARSFGRAGVGPFQLDLELCLVPIHFQLELPLQFI